MRLLCILGFHERSKGQARFNGPRPESVCRRCGAAMHKEHGKWKVSHDDAADQRHPDPSAASPD